MCNELTDDDQVSILESNFTFSVICITETLLCLTFTITRASPIKNLKDFVNKYELLSDSPKTSLKTLMKNIGFKNKKIELTIYEK